MNYAEKELLYQKINGIERRINSPRQISFYLDDHIYQAQKTYYFNFESKGGYIIIKSETDEQINLKIGKTPVCLNQSFYLEKGVHEVEVFAENPNGVGTIKICVYGQVSYYDTSYVKVENLENYSVISVFDKDRVTLYKYQQNISVIDTLQASSYDMCSFNQAVYVYLLNGDVLQVREYLEECSACVVTDYHVEQASQVKCSKGSVYIVKKGKMYLLDLNLAVIYPTNLQLKELLAVQDDKAIYRDLDGKIKLCNFSVSQNA